MWANTVWGLAGFSFACLLGLMSVNDPALHAWFGRGTIFFAICSAIVMAWPYVSKWGGARRSLQPDITIAAAIDYVVNDSRALLKRSPPPQVMEFGPMKGQLAQQRGVEHQDALNRVYERLASGDIDAWGRREFMPSTLLPTFDQAVRRISKEYWETAYLHPLFCFGGDGTVSHTVFPNFQNQPEPHYTALQLNQAQIRKVWPRKRWPTRILERWRRVPRIIYWRPFSEDA